MMTRIANEWQRRIAFNPHSTAGLHWGQELWKWDVNLYEGAAGIAAAQAARQQNTGQPFDNDSVLYDATRNTLQDTIDAAGGVELAYQRLQSSLATAQARYDNIAQINLPVRPLRTTSV